MEYKLSEFKGHPLNKPIIGDKAPAYIQAVVEVPSGSKAKYRLDEESGLLVLDRVLYSSVHYPANYGFIPQTIGRDGSPLDILVICSASVYPMTLINVRVIGVMKMTDQGQEDDKIIGVASDDINFKQTITLNDLQPYVTDQIQKFFEDYKKLEKKEVLVKSMGWREEAYKIINEAIEKYKEQKQIFLSKQINSEELIIL